MEFSFLKRKEKKEEVSGNSIRNRNAMLNEVIEDSFRVKTPTEDLTKKPKKK